jgi:uncharacterized protein (DUF2062 family)
MPRKLIKRYLPGRHAIGQYKPLNIFGRLLHDPNLWHLNRYSTSGAVAVGLFLAFMPIPFQMLPAAALAIMLRLNLPLAVALVWVTNPITIPPLFYFCYRVGAWVMGNVGDDMAFAWSWEWFRLQLGQVWEPFLIGSSVVASFSALLGYFAMRTLWRWHVVREWENRKKARARKRAAQRRQMSSPSAQGSQTHLKNRAQ